MLFGECEIEDQAEQCDGACSDESDLISEDKHEAVEDDRYVATELSERRDIGPLHVGILLLQSEISKAADHVADSKRDQ